MSQQLVLNTQSVEQDDVKSVLSRYAEVLNKAIEVDRPATWDYYPRTSGDGWLYIHIITSPGRTEIVRVDRVYGHSVDRILAIKPTYSYLTLYDDSNTPIAEYVDNNLYILLDFADIPSRIRAEILDNLLKDLVQNLKNYNSPDEIAKRLHRLLRHTGTDSVLASDTELRRLDDQLKELRADMIKKMISYRMITSRRSVAQKIDEFFTEEMAINMYEQLKAIGNGEELSIRGSEIHIPLGEIKISHDDNSYFIGDTVLVINVSENNGGIKCINSSGTQDGHPHPLADQQGNLYLGSISDSIAKLIGEMELVPVASIVAEYLHNYNESDARLTIDHWPTV